MNETPQAAIRIRIVRHRKARMDHHFMENGVIRRFVVLETPGLRDFLEKQRRTEIDPVDPSNTDIEMTRGDIWEMAKRTAKEMLRELYRSVAQAKAIKAGQALEDNREETKRTLGRQLIPFAAKTDAAGTLIFAGIRPGIPYCMELLSVDGDVRRVEGIDLARALEVSGAQVGETIRVTKAARHTVDVAEQHTGSHGSGKRSRKRSRVIFEITREAYHEPTQSGIWNMGQDPERDDIPTTGMPDCNIAIAGDAHYTDHDSGELP